MPAFHEATQDEINSALALAKSASDFLRNSTGSDRKRLLDAIADEMEADADLIKNRVGEETGYPQPRLDGEFGRTVMQLRVFGKVAEEGDWVGRELIQLFLTENHYQSLTWKNVGSRWPCCYLWCQ